MQSSRCSKGSTIAYAAHCQLESVFNRPIAGHANICPDSISTKPQDLETLISTFKHEILHALGFSVSLYSYYQGEEHSQTIHKANSSTITAKIIRKVNRPFWKIRSGYLNHSVIVITTPRVVVRPFERIFLTTTLF